MSKLIISVAGKTTKEYRLNKERVHIGRKPGSDIQLDDATVSGQHAVVITILNDSFLEDMSSTNGTKVNGNPVKKCFLQQGDKIEIGKFFLTYIHEAQPSKDFERTVMLKPKTASAALPSSVSAPAEPPPPPPPPPRPADQSAAGIKLLSGPGAGRQLSIVKNLTTLGKPGVQVAVISRRPQGFFIAHVDGEKPPLLNGMAIGFQVSPLRHNDILELAGIKMQFFVNQVGN